MGKTVKHQAQEQVVLAIEKISELTNDLRAGVKILKILYLDALVSGGEE